MKLTLRGVRAAEAPLAGREQQALWSAKTTSRYHSGNDSAESSNYGGSIQIEDSGAGGTAVIVELQTAS